MSARIGFATYPTAPRSLPRCSLSVAAVRKMTGMRGSVLSAFSAAMNSKPSMCGMLMSEMIRSGGLRRTR